MIRKEEKLEREKERVERKKKKEEERKERDEKRRKEKEKERAKEEENIVSLSRHSSGKGTRLKALPFGRRKHLGILSRLSWYSIQFESLSRLTLVVPTFPEGLRKLCKRNGGWNVCEWGGTIMLAFFWEIHILCAPRSTLQRLGLNQPIEMHDPFPERPNYVVPTGEFVPLSIRPYS